MPHAKDHDPGDEAPRTGHYAEVNIFGTHTGRTVHVHEGEPLPSAPRGFAWRGVVLDADANARHQTRISRVDSQVAVFVVPTDENLMIARHTHALVRRRQG